MLSIFSDSAWRIQAALSSGGWPLSLLSLRALLASARPAGVVLKGSFQDSLRLIWTVRIDVDVDVLNAPLRLLVTIARDPRTIIELNVADLRQPQAAPFAIRRQSRPALTSKLVG